MALDPGQGENLSGALIANFNATELELLSAMAETLVDGIDDPEWEQRQTTQMLTFRRIAETIVAKLNTTAPKLLEAAMLAATEAGRKAADADGAKPTAPADGRTTAREKARAEQTARAAWSTLAPVTQRIPGNAGQIYSQVIGRVAPATVAGFGATVDTALTAQQRRDAAQQALDVLTKRGITGFRDSAGRNWNLTSYIEMKTRTLVNQELIRAHTERMLEAGHNLVVVDSHRHPAPQCQPYEGQILSLDGETGTVERQSATTGRTIKVRIKATIQEARSKGFQHPNCRHAVSRFVPGASDTFTTEPDEEGYAATQKQRAIERALRDAKRKQAIAITPEAKRRDAARIKTLNTALRDHITEWDLKRRPKREQVNQGYRLDGGSSAPKVPTTPNPPTPLIAGGNTDLAAYRTEQAAYKAEQAAKAEAEAATARGRYDHIDNLDDLEAEMLKALEADDFDALDAIADRENVVREQLAAKERRNAVARARREEAAAAKRAAQDAEHDRLIAEGVDWEEATARAYGITVEQQRRENAIATLRSEGYSGAGFDELTREAYKMLLHEEWLAAENATNGFMLRREFEGTMDPLELWKVNEATARRRASDELRAWWDENGRTTLDDFRAGWLDPARGTRYNRGGDWLQ